MHHPQDYQYQAHLGAQSLQATGQIDSLLPIFQGQGNEPNVNQVKTDDQQVIYRIGQRFVSEKTVHQEDTPVLVQGPGDPNGQGNADHQVSEESPDHGGSGTGGFGR